MPRCFVKVNLTSIYLCAQPNASHVKYTSAQPFTPKFVKDHLSRDTKSTTTNTTKKLLSFRAQALYDERVHRRQLVLARRIQSQRTKAEKEKKKKGVVKREKMGRREAAEMGVWRLRREEARCVPCPKRMQQCNAMTPFYFLIGFWFSAFQVGCVCPVASVMAWVYVRVAWIDHGEHTGAGSDCSCDEGCDALSCWDACQARQGRFPWLDYDPSVVFSPCLRVHFLC